MSNETSVFIIYRVINYDCSHFHSLLYHCGEATKTSLSPFIYELSHILFAHTKFAVSQLHRFERITHYYEISDAIHKMSQIPKLTDRNGRFSSFFFWIFKRVYLIFFTMTAPHVYTFSAKFGINL